MDAPKSPRILLLMPKTSYRAADFLRAAAALGVDVRIASDRCHVLAEEWGVPLALDFRDAHGAARGIVAHARSERLDAIVATDDRSTVIAALAARPLGLPANHPDAAYAARNKAVMREKLHVAGVPSPRCERIGPDAGDPEALAAANRLGFPVVVKPLLMSASRGVIRADSPAELAAAIARVRAILRSRDVEPSPDAAAKDLLVEAFVPGPEVALEGIFRHGRLVTLALFDKPDPLDGPFFEETIYVTPSRLPDAAQAAVRDVSEQAALALGLRRGPVHAEVRLSPDGPVVVEVAGRSIGGLCSRTLEFATGQTLEQLILLDALDRDLPATTELRGEAAGVMMLPIPKRGILRQVKGLESARAVRGIVAIEITAPLEHEIVPLPEGSSYLGFAFARSADPASVEESLRRAAREIQLVIAPNLARRGSPA